MLARALRIAVFLAFTQSAAMAATVMRYQIQETFDVSAYFSGSFVYNSATKALSELQGSITQGGSAITVSGDWNGTYAIPPALQSDGSGGVADTVCNGPGGYACIYLDITAEAPTNLHTVTHLGMPSNFFVNSDLPLSGGVSSYQILALGPVTSAVPEPSAWTFLLTGFGAIGLLRRRRGLAISDRALQHAG